MKIAEAKYRDGYLMLKVDAADAFKAISRIKDGDYEIQPVSKKRSLDANAYAWVLIGLIADKCKMRKDDVYKQAIRDLGGNYEVMCIQNKAVAHMTKLWTDRGLGWQVETCPSKIDKCTTMVMYYGSSSFNIKEMSKFIDSLTQDCIALGIETKPKEYVDSLLEAWK